MKKFNKKAFTLVELVIVIAVIAILSVVLIPQLTNVINDAKISRDRAAASQMTLALQTSFPEGLPEGIEATDVRNILNSMGTTYSFKPQSSNNGSFWYNRNTNSIVFGTGSEIVENSVFAESTNTTLTSIEEIIPGYIILDTSISNLGIVTSSLRNLQSIKQYNAVESKINSLTTQNTGLTELQLSVAVEHLKNDFKPSNTLFVNDFDYFTSSSSNLIENIVFSDGITFLPQYLGDIKAVNNGILLPNSLKFISQDTILNKIEQIIVGQNIIETSIKYLNEEMLTTGNINIFSNYVLNKVPSLANLSANARANSVANVTFSAVMNAKNIITNEDGSQKMPISVEANIPSYYDGEICLSTEKCYQHISIDNNFITKSEYNALSVEEKNNYTPRIIDRNKILTMRFKYETLDTGYIKVNVIILDNFGLLCKGETTYFPEVEIGTVDFSNGNILFTNPNIPSFDAQDISYKIEILDEAGAVKPNGTFAFNANEVNTSSIIIEYNLGSSISNLDFMQQLVNNYQYVWFKQNGTLLESVAPDTTCYIKKIMETSGIDGNTTTTTTTTSKIFINAQNKLYEEYYKTTFIVEESKIEDTISVNIREEHLAYQRKLTAVSLPTEYLTSVLSENGIRYNIINAKVSVYKNTTLLASKTAIFGTPDNPIKTSYVREITDDTDQAVYFYAFDFKDPLYYAQPNKTEELVFTNKQVYSYSKLDNNTYSFKVKGTGEFDGQGVQLGLLNSGKVVSKTNYDAQYLVSYEIQPSYIAVRVKGLDSLYSLDSTQSIPNSTAYTNRLTYVYASERELINTEQAYTLKLFNGRSVAKKEGTQNTYTFKLTNGEEFNPLTTKIEFENGKIINASAFNHTVENSNNGKTVSIEIGTTTLIVECEISEIFLTIEYANPTIASSIDATISTQPQINISNLQSGYRINCLYDQIIDLQANLPANGYKFVGWFENGILRSVLRNYKYVMSDKSVILVAEYATDPSNLLVFTPSTATTTASLDWCYNKKITEVYIPSHFDIYKVTSIKPEVFNNCVNLATVVVPSTITTIGADAFNNTQFLTDLSSEGAIYFGYYLYKYIEPELNAPTTVSIKEGTTIIMDYAFQNCSSIETIVLPSTLISIGAYAFDCCDNLKNITITDNVTTIGNYAFRECTSLESININNVSTLGYYAFLNCVSLNSFVMSNNITILNSCTFQNCVMLTNITLHEGITTLGTSLFNGCSALVSISIPSTVTTINVSSVFSGCTALAEVTFAQNNNYRQIGASFFSNCPVLTDIKNLDIAKLLTIGSGAFSGCSSFDFGDLILGTGEQEEQISLSSSAFAYCYLLKTVTFKSPLNGTIIQNSTFAGCTALTQVNYASEINTINDSAFNGCIALNKLSGINFSSVNFIGNYAFTNCSNLSFGNVLIIGSFSADNVSIGCQSFYNCNKLKNVIINNENLYNAYGSAVRDNSLAPYAFQNCTELVSISLPINTKIIYNNAFQNCTKLQYINKVYNEEFVLQEKVSENLTTIASNVFTNTTQYFNNATAQTLTDNLLIKSGKLVGYLGTSSVVTLPNSIASIGDYAFANNLYLTEIIIPASITTIEESAFIGCLNLTKITFEENSTLATIGVNAFKNCEKLVTIILGQNLNSIGDYAFSNCDELISIYLLSATPATIGTESFSNEVSIYVPETSVEAYKSSWDAYKLQINRTDLPTTPVEPDPENPETPIVEPYTIIGTTLTAYNSNDTTFTVPNNVTTIGANAFRNNKTLISIILPASITSIEESAFSGCSKLEQIVFNSNITTLPVKVFSNCPKLKELKNLDFTKIVKIDNYAFYGCLSLNLINFKVYATTIGTNVFQNCSSLSTITFMSALPNNTLPALTFSGCTKLTTISLPSTITTIGASTFYNCKSLTTITNLNTLNLTNIGNSAFYCCEKFEFNNKTLLLGNLITMGTGVFQNCKAITTLNLSSANLPTNKLPSNTFMGCSSLTTINLPITLTTIGNSAFKKCSGLTSVNLQSNITTIEANAFAECNNLQTVNLNQVAILGISAFANCYLLETVSMPNTLTTLKAYTFENCKKLSTLNLQYITTFEGNVLKGCESLSTTTLSNNLSTIAPYTFSGWSGLTNIILPASVKIIGDYAFSDCEKLTSLDLSNVDATKLGSNIMFNCILLTEVNLPNNLTKISANLFYGASSLQTIFSISPNITTIENYAFFNCQSLTDMFIDMTNLTSIGDYAFYNCYNLNFGNTLTLSNINQNELSLGKFAFTNCKKLKNIVIASQKVKYSSSNSLAPSAFQNCTELLTITLPETPITHFYSNTFQNCIALTTINNLDLTMATFLDSNVFYNCQSLNFGDSLTTPLQISNSATSVLTLNASVFYNCKQIKAIEFCAQKIQYSYSYYENYLYSSTFYGCINLEKVILPASNKITKIGSSIFAYCINLTTIENLDYENVTILNSSAFLNCFNLNFGETLTFNQNITLFGSSVFNNCKKLKNVVFNGTLYNNTLPDSTFYGCNNLKTINISSDITIINSSVFFECFNLTNVNLDFSKVVAINNSAFYKCQLLNFVNGLTLGNLTKFGTYVFYGNNSLEKISIASLPNNTLPNYTFFNCFKLSVINLPSDLININSSAMSGCSSLNEINLPNTLATIGTYAFDGCVSLKTITLPNSVVNVGAYAFRFCSALTQANLSTNIAFTKIDSLLFYGCISLRTIIIPENISTISSAAFNYCSSLTTVYMLGLSPIKSTISNAFNNSYTHFIVPTSAKSDYLTATEWASIKTQIYDTTEFETINGFLIKGSTLIRYVGDASKIIITGTEITLKFADQADRVFNLNINNIGKFAFVQLNNLTSLKIKQEVTCSTNYYYNCDNLTEIVKY